MTYINPLTSQDLAILCSIFSKVHENISIQQLAFHLREYIIDTNDMQSKKKLLEFFLNCQTKLQSWTDEQWKLIFYRQISRHQKILSLINIQNNVLTRLGFNILKSKTINLIKQKIQKIETSLSEFMQYQNIQIQQEIKIKTNYFYKWCKFLNQSKNLKQLRFIQIQNLKKSLSFNQYSVKYITFTNWKKYLKVNKQQKSNINYIKKIIKQRYFFQFLNCMDQRLQIKNIENKLQKIVSNKIFILKKINVIKYFKKNSQNNKIKIIPKLYQNILCYKFIRIITDKISLNLIKSYKKIRQLHRQNYNQLITRKIFQIIKFRLNRYDSKILQIQYIRKNNQIKNLYSKILQKNNLNLLKNKIHKYLKHKKIQFVFSMLNFNKIREKNQFKAISIIQGAIKGSKIQKFIQNQFQLIKSSKNLNEKTSKTIKKMDSVKLINFFKKLKQYKIYKCNQLKKINTIKIQILKSKMNNQIILNYQSKKLRNLNIAEKKKNNNLSLLRICFNGFKKIFELNEIEQNILISTAEVYNRVLVYNSFYQIYAQSQTYIKHIKFSQITQKIILKQCFLKMFKKSMKIIQIVNHLQNQNNKKIKSLLFTSLKKIKSIQQQLIIKTKQKIIKNVQKNILTKIKQNFKRLEKQKYLTKYVNECNLLKLYKKIIAKKQKKQNQQHKILLIQCKNYINKFKVYTNQKILQSSQINQKYNRLIKFKSNIYLSKIQSIIKDKLKYKSIQKNKLTKLLQNQIKISYKRMFVNSKKFMKYNEQYLNNKKISIHNIFQKQFFKQLIFQKKCQKVKEQVNTNNMKKLFTNMKLIKQKNIKINKIQLIYSLHYLKKMMNIIKPQNKFYRNSQKQKLSELRFYLISKQLNTFQKLLIQYKQTKILKNQSMTLQMKLKQDNLKKFFNETVNYKSYMIKQKTAILHYALNLKKKGMNGIFQISKEKYGEKENQGPKTEPNHSFLKIERVLEKSRRNQKITDKISRFNMSRSRQAWR